MLNTLLNRPAYAKMSIFVANTLPIRCRYVAGTLPIRCRHVADTLQIRQKYVAHALLMRYHGHDGGITRGSKCQRITNYHSYADIR